MKKLGVQTFVVMLFIGLSFLLFACEGKAPVESSTPEDQTIVFDEKYAVANVTLVGTNMNHPNFMRGFTMQGLLSADQKATGEITSVAMVYTKGTYDDVKTFFTTGDYLDGTLVLPLIEQLDIDGKIRNLSGSRLDYLDGNNDDPIGFYGDGKDLLDGTTPHTTPGTYRFFLVVVGQSSILWIGEANRTFTVTQEEINLSNDFRTAFDLVVGTRLMEDADVSELTDQDKEDLVLAHFEAILNPLNLGLAITVEKDDHPNYPDDYKVTLTKNGQSSSKFVTIEFGPTSDTELYAVTLVRKDVTWGDMRSFQLGFRATQVVTEDNTRAYIIFFSEANLEAVIEALAGLTWDDIDDMDYDGKVKIITDLTYADGAGNTFYRDQVDLITGLYTFDATNGKTYYFYVATISKDATDVVRFIVQAQESFTFPTE